MKIRRSSIFPTLHTCEYAFPFERNQYLTFLSTISSRERTDLREDFIDVSLSSEILFFHAFPFTHTLRAIIVSEWRKRLIKLRLYAAIRGILRNSVRNVPRDFRARVINTLDEFHRHRTYQSWRNGFSVYIWKTSVRVYNEKEVESRGENRNRLYIGIK